MALAAVLTGASGFGMVWRWRSGRMRAARPGRGAPGVAGGTDDASGPAGGPRLTQRELGSPLGERATLLQFSSPYCAPCRATRALLAEVAGQAEGVAHVEVDVADRLDLVRMLDVRRTPAVFVLAADGRVTRRASGQPRRAEVLAAVAGTAGGAR